MQDGCHSVKNFNVIHLIDQTFIFLQIYLSRFCLHFSSEWLNPPISSSLIQPHTDKKCLIKLSTNCRALLSTEYKWKLCRYSTFPKFSINTTRILQKSCLVQGTEQSYRSSCGLYCLAACSKLKWDSKVKY
jgi:hypothetical protein